MMLAACNEASPTETTVIQQLDQATIDSLRAVGPDTIVVVGTDTVVQLDTTFVVRKDTTLVSRQDTTTLLFRDTIIVAMDTVYTIDTVVIATRDTVVIPGGSGGQTFYELDSVIQPDYRWMDHSAKYILDFTGDVINWMDFFNWFPELQLLSLPGKPFVWSGGIDWEYNVTPQWPTAEYMAGTSLKALHFGGSNTPSNTQLQLYADAGIRLSCISGVNYSTSLTQLMSPGGAIYIRNATVEQRQQLSDLGYTVGYVEDEHWGCIYFMAQNPDI